MTSPTGQGLVPSPAQKTEQVALPTQPSSSPRAGGRVLLALSAVQSSQPAFLSSLVPVPCLLSLPSDFPLLLLMPTTPLPKRPPVHMPIYHTQMYKCTRIHEHVYSHMTPEHELSAASALYRGVTLACQPGPDSALQPPQPAILVFFFFREEEDGLKIKHRLRSIDSVLLTSCVVS